jgi:hypothetical protein
VYHLKASHLKLKTDLATIPTDQGSIYWDEDEETIAVILNGSTTKVGEDIFFQVKNQSGATIPKGTAVRFDGVVGASGRINIVPFLANGSNPSIYFLGVTYEAIANGADGKALFNGKIRGVNTTAFAVGDILYASPTVAGGFTTTKPVAPNNIISVAAVLSSGANGILLIRPQIGSNINNDEGVKITTPTTGDILQLQASGLWENKSLAGAGFLSGSGTTNYLAKFTAAGTVGDSGIYQDPSDNRIVINNNYNGISRLQINNIDSGANAKTLVIALTTGNRYLALLSHGQNATGSIAGLSNAGLQELQAGSDSTALLINAAGAIPIVFSNGSGIAERMRITPDGNLILNATVNAGFRLDVNGSLRANTRVNFASLPTSSSGLVSGDLWRNGTVINIIP